MKKLFTLLFVFLAALNASAEEVTFDFENNNGNWPVGEGVNFADGNLTQPLVVDGVSLTGIQGDATQPCRLMKDNNGITALYVYKLGSLKFNAPEGKALTTIAVTMKSGTFDLTPNNGAVADNTWTGNATEVVFNHANSGNRQILKMVVTIADENDETVKPGAVTYDTEVTDIAAFNAIEDGKVAKLTLNNARVNGVKNGSYYVEDATGATVIKGVELTAATALNGYIIGTKATDNGIDYMNDPAVAVEYQLTATDATTFEATATTLVGTVMTGAEATTQANYGRLITLENVSISGSGQNKTLTDAEGHTLSIKARDYMSVLPGDYVWPEKASKITGIIIYYMTGWFLMPISADAIVAAGVQPTEVTFAFNESLHTVGEKLMDINGFIFNETFTIDNVSLQITAGSAQSAIYADANRGTCLVMYPMYAMMGITAPEGYAVTKIEFTQAGNGDLNMTPMVGTVEDHTWTGNADVVYFTMPQKTGTAYLAKATITLAEKNAETVTAQIEYTECANIAAFNALADGTPAKVMLTDAEVIGVSANGYGTAWIQDATGGCFTQYSTLVSAFVENNKINGYVYTIARKNSGNTQMKEAIHTTKSSLEKETINELTVVEGTLAEVNVAANKNKVVKISGSGANLTMTSATAGTLTQGDATIDVNNGTDTANQQLHKIENWTKDTTLENITIVAILTGKSDTANQLLPISITDSTSGISNINAADVNNVQIYNLQGVRMKSVQKGLNIINGKKIVMK
jgi:hypothetical protein